MIQRRWSRNRHASSLLWVEEEGASEVVLVLCQGTRLGYKWEKRKEKVDSQALVCVI